MGLREGDYTTTNEKIAKILGFVKLIGHRTNGKEDKLIQWSFPKEFQYLMSSSPQTCIPDFAYLIKQGLNFKSLPLEFSNYE